jgi:hypothetical protein
MSEDLSGLKIDTSGARCCVRCGWTRFAHEARPEKTCGDFLDAGEQPVGDPADGLAGEGPGERQDRLLALDRAAVAMAYDTDPSVPREADAYLQCPQCLEAAAALGFGAENIRATFSVGMRGDGLQVYCEEHQVNVAVIRFRLREAT